MKRIIDIDEDYYENLKYNVEQGQKYKPWEIIVNSTPYEERPQGEWIEQKNYPFRYNCNKCGKENTHKSNYCECCGTRMKSSMKINNEDAIKEIMEIIPVLDNIFVFSAEDKRTALKLAIESLKNERSQGEEK